MAARHRFWEGARRRQGRARVGSGTRSAAAAQRTRAKRFPTVARPARSRGVPDLGEEVAVEANFSSTRRPCCRRGILGSGTAGGEAAGRARFSRVHARGNFVVASIYRTLQCVFPAIFWFFYCGATAPHFVGVILLCLASVYGLRTISVVLFPRSCNP